MKESPMEREPDYESLSLICIFRIYFWDTVHVSILYLVSTIAFTSLVFLRIIDTIYQYGISLFIFHMIFFSIVYIGHLMKLAQREYKRNTVYYCNSCGGLYRKYQVDTTTNKNCFNTHCNEVNSSLIRVSLAKEKRIERAASQIAKHSFTDCIRMILYYEYKAKKKLDYIERSVDALLLNQERENMIYARRKSALPNVSIKKNVMFMDKVILKKLERAQKKLPYYGTLKVRLIKNKLKSIKLRPTH